MTTAEENEIVRMKNSMRRLSEWLAALINQGASFEKIPDSSSPLEASMNVVIIERLSQSISFGVLSRRLGSSMTRAR